ncbi:MAG: (2Fe-2S) ferredoxin domain-containing protein [Hormoscilla sp. GM7CHS1pb]|nr:(2Fe-2S) ferredoxin domain-containing protein [Hormoscilla sp. GM7CHS1pb]
MTPQEQDFSPTSSSTVNPKADTKHSVLVCQYRSCEKNGSAAVLAAFESGEIPGVEVTGSNCLGQCSTGPTVRVLPEETWYCRVQPQDVPEVIERHLLHGKPVARLLHPRFHPYAQYYIP